MLLIVIPFLIAGCILLWMAYEIPKMEIEMAKTTRELVDKIIEKNSMVVDINATTNINIRSENNSKETL